MSRIVQLTDTHIVAPGRKAYGMVDTARALQRTIKHINALPAVTDGIDAVILTGDLTDHGTAEEYEHLLALLQALVPPIHVVPGNHDTREAMRDALSATTSLPESGPLNWHVPFSDFDVIGLDSLVDGHAHGELTKDTLDWLGDRLDELAGRPMLLALHHPPFDTGILDMDRQKLKHPETLLEVARRSAGPVQIICGHVHRHIITMIDGFVAMIAPAPAHAVTFDQRPAEPATLTFEPGAVLIHEWRQQDGAGHFLSHLSPFGPFDGPHPFDDGD
ncbi:MAG: phosphodiesterase [Pseudomonadota bacterium]